jgi:hypothetical protein
MTTKNIKIIDNIVIANIDNIQYLANCDKNIINEKPNSTLGEKPNSTLSKTPNSTLDETPNSTLDETPNSTLDETPNSTLAETPNSTLAETPNSTLAETPNSISNLNTNLNPNPNLNPNVISIIDTNQPTHKIEKKRGRKKKIIINDEADIPIKNIILSDNFKDTQDNEINPTSIDNLKDIQDNEIKALLIDEPLIITNDKLQKKSNDFLKELLLRQLPNINIAKKLTYNDIKRISKFLVSSIFDEINCSIWNGYITNEKNQVKGTYINFYFNQKKIALHRLLYLNFIGDILNTEYIKFSCANKGKCCNIYHMKKYSYNSNLSHGVQEHTNDNSVHIIQNKNDLTIEL